MPRTNYTTLARELFDDAVCVDRDGRFALLTLCPPWGIAVSLHKSERDANSARVRIARHGGCGGGSRGRYYHDIMNLAMPARERQTWARCFKGKASTATKTVALALAFLCAVPSALAQDIIGDGEIPSYGKPTSVLVHGVNIVSIPWVDERGVSWDGFSGTGPDVFFIIYVDGAERYRSGTINDLAPRDLPGWMYLDPAFVYVPGQDVELVLYDKDPTRSEFIAGFQVSGRVEQAEMGMTVLNGQNGARIEVEVMVR